MSKKNRSIYEKGARENERLSEVYYSDLVKRLTTTSKVTTSTQSKLQSIFLRDLEVKMLCF